MSEIISVTNSLRETLWPRSIGASIGPTALSRGAAVLVGSGMSRNAEMLGGAKRPPDWAELSTKIVEKLCPGDDSGQEKMLREAGAVSGFLRLAEKYDARFGRAALNDLIIANVNDQKMRPSVLHNLLVRLPWTDIFTTNWDTLLERAAEQQYQRKYNKVYQPEDLPITSRPRIFKLHGSFPSTTPFTFTEEDFRKYPIQKAPFVNAVQQAMLEHVMVLVGFSGEDPNFLRWSGWVRDRLGDTSPKIIMVSDFRGSADNIEVMKALNIITINIFDLPNEIMDAVPDGITDDYAMRLGAWLAYLHKNDHAYGLVWPNIETSKAVQQRSSDSNFSTLTNLHSVLKEIKSTYRGWLIAPPDLREELLENAPICIENLILSSEKTDFDTSSDSDSALQRNRSEHLDLDSVHQGQKQSFERILKRLEIAIAKNVEDEDSIIDIINSEFRHQSEALSLFAETYRDYLWLFPIRLRAWPILSAKVLQALLLEDTHNNQRWPDNTLLCRRGTNKPEFLSDLAVDLAEHLLQVRRTTSGRMAQHKSLARKLKRYFVKHNKHNRYNQTLYQEALTCIDRGNIWDLKYITNQWKSDSADPLCMMRLAGLYGVLDTINETPRHSNKRCDTLTNAFRACRENVSYEDSTFNYVSRESWILAYVDKLSILRRKQSENNHEFDFNDQFSTDKNLFSNDHKSRLNELIALKCDPGRELRRIERTNDYEAIRDGLRILDSVGWQIYSSSLSVDDPLEFNPIQQNEIPLNEFGGRAAVCFINHAADLLSKDRGFQKVDQAVSDGITMLLRCRIGAANGPTRIEHWSDAAKHLPGIGYYLAQHGKSVSRTALLCIEALDAIVKRLLKTSDYNVQDGDHFHNVISILSELSREMKPHRQGDAINQTLTLQWPISFIEESLDILCGAMKAFNKHENYYNGKDEITISLIGLMSILQHQICIRDYEEEDEKRETVENMLLKLWDVSYSGDTTLMDPLTIVQRISPDGLWENPIGLRNPKLQQILSDFVPSEENPDFNEKEYFKLLRILRLYDCIRDLKFAVAPEIEERFDVHIPRIYKNSKKGFRRWEWLLINEIEDVSTKDFQQWLFEEKLSQLDPEGLIGGCASDTCDVLENLAWALRHNRSSFQLDSDERLSVVIDWLICLIGKNPGGLVKRIEVKNWILMISKNGIFEKEEALSKARPEGVTSLLVALKTLKLPVAPFIPKLAQYFSRSNSGVTPDVLGGFLREGLISSQSTEFRNSVKATDEWLKLCESPDEQQPMMKPPQALLGALSQTLASSSDHKDERVLNAMCSLARDENNWKQPFEILPELLNRVTTAINSTQGEELRKQFVELTSILADNKFIEQDPIARELLTRIKQQLNIKEEIR